jgi:hypothetical protein
MYFCDNLDLRNVFYVIVKNSKKLLVLSCQVIYYFLNHFHGDRGS